MTSLISTVVSTTNTHKKKNVNSKQKKPYSMSQNKPDKKMSDSTKFMIGATAVAVITASMIAARKGAFGVDIQKMMGGLKEEVSHKPKPKLKPKQKPPETSDVLETPEITEVPKGKPQTSEPSETPDVPKTPELKQNVVIDAAQETIVQNQGVQSIIVERPKGFKLPKGFNPKETYVDSKTGATISEQVVVSSNSEHLEREIDFGNGKFNKIRFRDGSTDKIFWQSEYVNDKEVKTIWYKTDGVSVEKIDILDPETKLVTQEIRYVDGKEVVTPIVQNLKRMPKGFNPKETYVDSKTGATISEQVVVSSNSEHLEREIDFGNGKFNKIRFRDGSTDKIFWQSEYVNDKEVKTIWYKTDGVSVEKIDILDPETKLVTQEIRYVDGKEVVTPIVQNLKRMPKGFKPKEPYVDSKIGATISERVVVSSNSEHLEREIDFGNGKFNKIRFRDGSTDKIFWQSEYVNDKEVKTIWYNTDGISIYKIDELDPNDSRKTLRSIFFNEGKESRIVSYVDEN